MERLSPRARQAALVVSGSPREAVRGGAEGASAMTIWPIPGLAKPAVCLTNRKLARLRSPTFSMPYGLRI